MTPQERLKTMLISTDRMDTNNDPPSPLIEADPKSLDEFFARIDSDLKLGNVPNPRDRGAIIDYNRALRLRFLADERAVATKTPRSRPTKAEVVKKASFLEEEDE